MYSRGPIIRTLELISAFAGLLAIVALIFALVTFSDQLNLIQQSRQKSATDTCYLFRSVVFAAAGRGRIANADAFLYEVGLDNCQRYGRSVTSLTHAGRR